MTNTIDLNNPPDGHNYSVSVEPNETERNVRLFKDVGNYSVKSVAAQIALYFVQEQGESAEFTGGVNEHLQRSYWTNQRTS